MHCAFHTLLLFRDLPSSYSFFFFKLYRPRTKTCEHVASLRVLKKPDQFLEICPLLKFFMNNDQNLTSEKRTESQKRQKCSIL